MPQAALSIYLARLPDPSRAVSSQEAEAPAAAPMQIERIRTLSDCAQQLNSAHDKDAGRYLAQASGTPQRRGRRAAPPGDMPPGRAVSWHWQGALPAGMRAAAVQQLLQHVSLCSRICGRSPAAGPAPHVPARPARPPACPQKMAEELFALPLEEALPILRAYGHYLKWVPLLLRPCCACCALAAPRCTPAVSVACRRPHLATLDAPPPPAA